jgi:hypothetical protein
MQINENTYEEVLYKLLLVASAQGTSPRQSLTKEQMLEQLQDWISTNAPIGIRSLLEYARYLDNF